MCECVGVCRGRGRVAVKLAELIFCNLASEGSVRVTTEGSGTELGLPRA